MGRPQVKVRIIELDEVYMSVSAAARAIHGDQGAITRVLKGERKQHKGYTFAVEEEKKVSKSGRNR